MPKKPKHTLAELEGARDNFHIGRWESTLGTALSEADCEIIEHCLQSAINQRTASKANLGRGHRKVKDVR